METPTPQITLVVEERTHNDTFGSTHRRICQFLHGGVEQVWIVDPLERAVTVWRKGLPMVLDEAGPWPDDHGLPDLRCSLSDLLGLR
jgi:Uma2 family endonuclease